MLLAIDIGNTNITFGLFCGKKLARRFDIPTKRYNFKDLKKEIGSTAVEDAIICSVVPSSTTAMSRDLKKYLIQKPYIVGQDIKVPIKNRYRNPRQVGQDRLVNAYAGVALYGQPLVVVDFGTAITFDIISRKNEYRGGMILPGLEMSLSALTERTALLPKIKLKRPVEFIGRDTQNSMLSGIVYGFATLTDGLIKKIKHKLGRPAQVIATGGNVALIGRYCRGIDIVCRDLTLKGLNIIYNIAI